MKPSMILTIALPLLWSCSEKSPESTTTSAPELKAGASNELCCEELDPVTGLPDTSIYQLESEWQDQRGEKLALDRFRGKPIVLAMMFTTCEYACPMILADLKAIEAALGENRSEVGFVLVSFDSDKDTPPVLEAYARDNDLDQDRWTLLHGASGDVRELAAVLGIQYKRSQAVGFSHSNSISVLGADGCVLHQQKGLGASPDETVATIAKAVGSR